MSGRTLTCREFVKRAALPVLILLIATPLPGRLTAAEPDSLDAAIEYARQALKKLDGIRDYSAYFLKRERVDGKLGPLEYAIVKVREKPFSVYMRFVKPESVKGREALYVKGKHDGMLLAHEPATDYIGTVKLDPQGGLAMRGQRYPITEAGFRNLAVKLIERGEKEKKRGADCKVTFRKNASINDRPATVIEVLHTRRRPDDEFYRVRIYIDNELQIPTRYVAHDWPEKPGGEPVLLEEYTYLNVKLNQGFTNHDFDITNKEYRFPAIGFLGRHIPEGLWKRPQ